MAASINSPANFSSMDFSPRAREYFREELFFRHRPEIGRVIFIAKGRIAGDGAKADMLTDRRVSDVFGGPMKVDLHDGYYSARGAS